MSEGSLKHSIYPHGGSRLYFEEDNERKLIVDTYLTAEYAIAVRDFTQQWLLKHPEALKSE